VRPNLSPIQIITAVNIAAKETEAIEATENQTRSSVERWK